MDSGLIYPTGDYGGPYLRWNSWDGGTPLYPDIDGHEGGTGWQNSWIYPNIGETNWIYFNLTHTPPLNKIISKIEIYLGRYVVPISGGPFGCTTQAAIKVDNSYWVRSEEDYASFTGGSPGVRYYDAAQMTINTIITGNITHLALRMPIPDSDCQQQIALAHAIFYYADGTECFIPSTSNEFGHTMNTLKSLYSYHSGSDSPLLCERPGEDISIPKGRWTNQKGIRSPHRTDNVDFGGLVVTCNIPLLEANPEAQNLNAFYVPTFFLPEHDAEHSFKKYIFESAQIKFTADIKPTSVGVTDKLELVLWTDADILKTTNLYSSVGGWDFLWLSDNIITDAQDVSYIAPIDLSSAFSAGKIYFGSDRGNTFLMNSTHVIVTNTSAYPGNQLNGYFIRDISLCIPYEIDYESVYPPEVDIVDAYQIRNSLLDPKKINYADVSDAAGTGTHTGGLAYWYEKMDAVSYYSGFNPQGDVQVDIDVSSPVTDQSPNVIIQAYWSNDAGTDLFHYPALIRGGSLGADQRTHYDAGGMAIKYSRYISSKVSSLNKSKNDFVVDSKHYYTSAASGKAIGLLSSQTVTTRKLTLVVHHLEDYIQNITAPGSTYTTETIDVKLHNEYTNQPTIIAPASGITTSAYPTLTISSTSSDMTVDYIIRMSGSVSGLLDDINFDTSTGNELPLNTQELWVIKIKEYDVWGNVYHWSSDRSFTVNPELAGIMNSDVYLDAGLTNPPVDPDDFYSATDYWVGGQIYDKLNHGNQLMFYKSQDLMSIDTVKTLAANIMTFTTSGEIDYSHAFTLNTDGRWYIYLFVRDSDGQSPPTYSYSSLNISVVNRKTSTPKITNIIFGNKERKTGSTVDKFYSPDKTSIDVNHIRSDGSGVTWVKYEDVFDRCGRYSISGSIKSSVAANSLRFYYYKKGALSGTSNNGWGDVVTPSPIPPPFNIGELPLYFIDIPITSTTIEFDVFTPYIPLEFLDYGNNEGACLGIIMIDSAGSWVSDKTLSIDELSIVRTETDMSLIEDADSDVRLYLDYINISIGEFETEPKIKYTLYSGTMTNKTPLVLPPEVESYPITQDLISNTFYSSIEMVDWMESMRIIEVQIQDRSGTWSQLTDYITPVGIDALGARDYHSTGFFFIETSPNILNVVCKQKVSRTAMNFSITASDEDAVDLTIYGQYKISGGSWLPMTILNPRMPSTEEGITVNIKWDIGSDIGADYSGYITYRFWVADYYVSSGYYILPTHLKYKHDPDGGFETKVKTFSDYYLGGGVYPMSRNVIVKYDTSVGELHKVILKRGVR